MPIQAERIQRWKNLNSLHFAKPLVHYICSPQTLGDFVPEDSLLLSEPVFRNLERELKWRIYKADNFQDDAPISNEVFVPLHQ